MRAVSHATEMFVKFEGSRRWGRTMGGGRSTNHTAADELNMARVSQPLVW